MKIGVKSRSWAGKIMVLVGAGMLVYSNIFIDGQLPIHHFVGTICALLMAVGYVRPFGR